MDFQDEHYRRDSTTTTVAQSQRESRDSTRQLTGSGHAQYLDSRPTTSQYARHFAESQFAADSQTTLQGRDKSPPLTPTTPTIHHLSGKPMGPYGPGGTAPEDTRSKGRTALIMTALCMAVFLAALDTTIITTALPTIAQHFESPAGYTWIGSGYLLGAAASTPIWGKISDIFGRKPILMIANGVFLAGSLIAALSTNIGMLITARVIQGVGGGGLLVLVNICIGDLFSMRARGQYYGLVGGTWALASAIGPLLGGIFTEEVTWRWCFYINLPLDGVALLIIFFTLGDLHKAGTPIVAGLKAIDWLGALLIVGGTLMLLLGIQFGGESYPWNSAIVLCLIIFGVVTVALFFLVEWRVAPYPIIPMEIFRVRSNLACLTVCLLHGITFMGGAYYLPLYFQTCLGATPILSGVYTLATAIPLSLVSGLTGVFIKVTGNYMIPIIGGFSLMTLGYGLFIDLTATSSWAKIILYQIVAGLGVGPLFQAPLIALQSSVPKGDIAAATSTFQFVRNFATAISVVIGSVVFQNIITDREQILIDALGPQSAEHLGGFNAGAEVGFINALPAEQKTIARGVFGDAFHYMWIMYCVFSSVGLLTTFLITKQELSQKHHRVSTGLQFEEEKRLERELRRKSRKSLRLGGSDPELAASVLQSQTELAEWRKSRIQQENAKNSPTAPSFPSPPEVDTQPEFPSAIDEKREEQRKELEKAARRERRESRKLREEELQREREDAKAAEQEIKRAFRENEAAERQARRERGEHNKLRKSRPNSLSTSIGGSRPTTAGTAA